MKKWEDVVNSEGYLNLPVDKRKEVKRQYFQQVIMPQIKPTEVKEAAKQFHEFTLTFEEPTEQASSKLSTFGKNMLKSSFETGSRVLGVGIGLLNSPLAFAWGGLEARELDRKQFDSLPFAKKLAVSFGGAFNSAWRSVTKKGDFGTLFGEFWLSKTGETIEESLPSKLKWTAPTVEMLVNIASDPLFAGSVGKSLVKLKIPKDFQKFATPEFLADIRKLQSLEHGEKLQLQTKLVELLENRKDYMKWWQQKSLKLENFENAKEAFRKTVPKTENLLSKGTQNFQLVGKPKVPQAQRLIDVTRQVEKLKRTVDVFDEFQVSSLTKLENEQARLLKNDVSRKLAILTGREEQLQTIKNLGITSRTGQISKLVDDAIKQHLETAEGLWQAGRKAIRTGGKQNVQHGFQLIEKAKKTRLIGIENAEKFLKLNDSYTTKIVKKTLGKEYELEKAVTLRASGGFLAGIEQDQEGNFHYDLAKGLAGGVLLAGGWKLAKSQTAKRTAKQFEKLLSNYPAWSKVHNMIGESKTLPFAERFSGLLGRLNVNFLDRIAPLKQVGTKAYDEASVFSSYKDISKLKFQKLVDGFAKVRNDEVLVTDYITAHRALDRASRGFPNPGGVTFEEAKLAIQNIEDSFRQAGKNPAILREVLKNWKTWTRTYILDDFHKAGLISDKLYNEILKTNKWYATFEVLEHLPVSLEKIPALANKEYYSVANQKIIKALKGTEKQITNPIESTIRKFANAQQVIARNKVASKVIDEAGELFQPVAMTEKEFRIMQNQGLNPIIHGSWNVNEFDTISRFVNGNLERFLAPREITDVMKQISPSQAPKLVRLVGNVFRSAATSVSPVFTVRNMFRDGLMAYTNAPAYRAGQVSKFAKAWTKGFYNGMVSEFYKPTGVYEQYVKSGGGFGYVGELRRTNYAKDLLFKKGIVKTSKDIVTSPLTLIEKISSAVELAPRLGTFDEAVLQGFNPRDAAIMARRSTIDFNRGGSLTKVLNQWIPFLNARVQSKVSLLESARKNPKLVGAKIALTLLPASLGTYAWNRLYHSKLYDDIPREIRDNYFITVLGTEKNQKIGKLQPKYLAIPKGDIGQLVWNPVEKTLDGLLEKDRENFEKFLINYLSDAVSPVSFARDGELSGTKVIGELTPPIVKGVVENAVNLNFYTGREIVPYWTKKNIPPELQFRENTPETFKWLGKRYGLSPLKLQNFAANILAGYGRQGLSPTAMLRGLRGSLVKTTSGDVQSQAWTVMKDIEQGYSYTQAYAKELIKTGNNHAALKLLTDWNKGLKKQTLEWDKKFSKHGLKHKGGITKSYTFTSNKIKYLFESRFDKRQLLDKKLSIR